MIFEYVAVNGRTLHCCVLLANARWWLLASDVRPYGLAISKYILYLSITNLRISERKSDRRRKTWMEVSRGTRNERVNKECVLPPARVCVFLGYVSIRC